MTIDKERQLRVNNIKKWVRWVYNYIAEVSDDEKVVEDMGEIEKKEGLILNETRAVLIAGEEKCECPLSKQQLKLLKTINKNKEIKAKNLRAAMGYKMQSTLKTKINDLNKKFKKNIGYDIDLIEGKFSDHVIFFLNYDIEILKS